MAPFFFWIVLLFYWSLTCFFICSIVCLLAYVCSIEIFKPPDGLFRNGRWDFSVSNFFPQVFQKCIACFLSIATNQTLLQAIQQRNNYWLLTLAWRANYEGINEFARKLTCSAIDWTQASDETSHAHYHHVSEIMMPNI